MAFPTKEQIEKLTPDQLAALAQAELVQIRKRTTLLGQLKVDEHWIDKPGVIPLAYFLIFLGATELNKPAPPLHLVITFSLVLIVILQASILRTNRRIDALVELLADQINPPLNTANRSQSDAPPPSSEGDSGPPQSPP